MRRRARLLGMALAAAQTVAISPHWPRYERAEHLHRVGKAIRKTRPGR